MSHATGKPTKIFENMLIKLISAIAIILSDPNGRDKLVGVVVRASAICHNDFNFIQYSYYHL